MASLKERCITAVEKARGGREMTNAEKENIVARVTKAMKSLAVQDPLSWNALPYDQQMKMAGKYAAQQLLQEKQKEFQQRLLTIEKADYVQNLLDARQQYDPNASRLDAVRGLLTRDLTDRAQSSRSVESVRRAHEARLVSELADVMDAIDPKLFSMLENVENQEMLVRAIHGEKVSDPQIAAAAKKFTEVFERTRGHLNALGADIGQLDNYTGRQTHDRQKVVNAGQDAWVSTVTGLLDRRKYVNPDGRMMTNDEVVSFLKEAFKTIAMDGMNKDQGPNAGTGMRARRNDNERVIHFKDADSEIAYAKEYGSKDAFITKVQSWIRSTASDLSLLEMFGPNPDNAFELVLSNARKQDTITAMFAKNGDALGKIDTHEAKLQAIYDYLSGNYDRGYDNLGAQLAQGIRNFEGLKLAGAGITAFGDEASVGLMSLIHGTGWMKTFMSEFSSFNKQARTDAAHMGLAAQAFLGDFLQAGDTLFSGNGVTDKMTKIQIALSMLSSIDNARKRAWGAGFMSKLGQMTREFATLADLHDADNRILSAKGISEAEWQVWRSADPNGNFGFHKGLLTPESIKNIPDATIQQLAAPEIVRLQAELKAKIAEINANKMLVDPGAKAQLIKQWETHYGEKIAAAPEGLRDSAILRLLSVTLEESDMAVTTVNESNKLQMGDNILQRGTLGGELGRFITQFKSFPWSLVYNNFKRGMDNFEPSAGWFDKAKGRAAYIGGFIALTGIFGTIVDVMKDVMNGKEVKDYSGKDTKSKMNILAGIMQGGGMGVYADYFLAPLREGRNVQAGAGILGPAFQTMADAVNLTTGNIIPYINNKDTNAKFEAFKFAKDKTPFIGLPIAKQVLDHYVFHGIQESLRAGYLGKARQNLYNHTGQGYWWQPNRGIDTADPSKILTKYR